MHNVDVRNVSLGQMQYFVKVAEYRSVTNAARYFNLSQPTLSKKLKSLEAQLDMQLFRRTGHELLLTPAGAYLYQSWRRRLQLIEEEIQHAHVLQTGWTKSLVVACLDSFRPDRVILPVLEPFTEIYPDIHIRVETDAAQDIRRMLLCGEADAIFTVQYDFEGKELEGIAWRQLGKTTHCACMKRSSPLAGREALSMEDLKCASFICISPQYLPEYMSMLQSLCARYGFSPDIVRYVASASSLTMNLQGDGDVFICDRYYADLNEAAHCRIPIRDTESGFVLAWRRDNHKPCLEQFVQEVLLQFGITD